MEEEKNNYTSPNFRVQDDDNTVKDREYVMTLPKMNDPVKEEHADKEKGPQALPRKTVKVISTKSALKIFYYLIAVNGEICDEEMEQFDSVGKELDPKYTDDRQLIIDECRMQMDNLIDPEDSFDVIKEGVSEAIAKTIISSDSFITPKMLLWDLLTIAYSDNCYDEIERKLIKSVVRQLDIDKAEFLELESSYLTMRDIQREIDWIKTTDRQYKVIEAIVNELEDRKSVIMESVKDLISL